MKDSADEDEDHGDEKDDKKRDRSPRVARGDVTHSLHRSTADVTGICVDVTNTAAVAELLHGQRYTKY